MVKDVLPESFDSSLVAMRSRGVTQEDKFKRLFAAIHGRFSTKRAISSQSALSSKPNNRPKTNGPEGSVCQEARKQMAR
jgi:hypothetical protein